MGAGGTLLELLVRAGPACSCLQVPSGAALTADRQSWEFHFSGRSVREMSLSPMQSRSQRTSGKALVKGAVALGKRRNAKFGERPSG